MNVNGRPSLLFVNQHYYPDVASTGQHLTDLAEYLAAEGWDVGVLTGRVRYTAGMVEAPAREIRNGVRIERVRQTAFGRSTVLGRLTDYATFYVQALRRLLGAGPSERVVLLTTPPLLSFIGWLARRLRGVRYGIWSMDLHPDAEFAAGMLDARSPLGRLLEWANAAGYRGAELVVDLGAYMKARLVEKGDAAEHAHTVHVWSRAEEIEPTPRERNPLIAELGLSDRFVVMYSGNAGIVHEFGPILEAMRRLKDDPRIFFLFVGSGPQRQSIERFAREHRIANFSYRPYFAREQLRYSLAVADAHLISLRRPFVGIAVPGKLYGIMASGRAAIFVGPESCESADAIRAAHCGAIIDPDHGDPAERLVALLRTWSDNPVLPSSLGRAGRAAFLARYERERNCEEFARVLSSVWDPDRIGAARTDETARPAPAARA